MSRGSAGRGDSPSELRSEGAPGARGAAASSGAGREVPYEALRGTSEVGVELASRGGAGPPPAAATAASPAATAGHGHGGDARRHDSVPEGLRHTSEAAADLANAVLQRFFSGRSGSSREHEAEGKAQQHGGGGDGGGEGHAAGDVVPEELRHTSEAAADLANRVLEALSGPLRRGHELRSSHPPKEEQAASRGERGSEA